MKSVCFYCADQNPHRDKSRGITVYTESLIAGLQRKGGIALSAVTSKSSAGVPDGVPQKVLPFRTDHIPGRLVADHFHPWFTGKIDAELWHYPKGFLPLGPQVRALRVGTIADTILQHYADHYPEDRSALAYRYWIGVLKNSIAHFDLIITISEAAKTAITEFAERYKIPLPPIAISYIGVEMPDFPNDNPKRTHVLHIASKQPHKRTRWLLQQWRAMQRAKLDLPFLRLVGDMDSEAQEVASDLRNIERVSAEKHGDLLEDMRRSLAVLLPSEIEGFGIPAVEGYFAGAPVAYVAGTSVEEVLGPGTPGGFTFETGSFQKALDQVLNMPASQIQQKKEDLAERFSWEQCAGRTLAAYNQVLSLGWPT